MAAAYGMAKFTLVPSLAESFCLVAAESIACGTPVIASNVMALPELVHDEKTGFLATVENIADFSRKTGHIFDMPVEKYNQLRLTTRQFAKKKFLLHDSWVAAYTALYEQVIANHSCTPFKS